MPRMKTRVMAAAVVAVAASGASATTAHAARCQFVAPAVKKENAAATRLARRLSHNPDYTLRRKTFTPEIRRTRRFTGFGSIVVRAPKGTAPVVGSFRLRGADRCSIEITSAHVVLRRNAYVIRFKAPGEQGDPGRVTVLLVSV